jgi:hypothetical protein
MEELFNKFVMLVVVYFSILMGFMGWICATLYQINKKLREGEK